MPKRILPDYGDQVYKDELFEAIGIALGRASTCWIPGTGEAEFDSETARQLVSELFGVAEEYARRYPQIKKRPELYHDDETMQKVYQALRAGFLDDFQIVNAVTAMQNRGIYFREIRQGESETMPVFTSTESHPDKARRFVTEYFNKRKEDTDDFVMTFDDTYVVWFCYILGGWKALVSTSVPDGMYYELTHDRVKNATYLDAYKKIENVVIPDGEDIPDRLDIGGLITGKDRNKG